MEKRNGEGKEDRRVPLEYYVAKTNTVLTRICGKCDVNVYTLRQGMLVEALEEFKDSVLRVRVHDSAELEVWHGTEWRCHRFDLISVPLEIWKLLAAVPSPQDRIRLASNKSLCEELKNVAVNDLVWFCPEPSEHVKHLAVVKYIGPVPELGPGSYFGLDLLDNRETSKTSLLSQEYFASKHSDGRFATLTNICPFKTEILVTEGTEKNTTGVTKTDVDNYLHDKKKLIPVSPLVDKLFTFDDNKNNNHEIGGLSKEHRQTTKSTFHENDIGTTSRTINGHNLLQFGNYEDKRMTRTKSALF